MSDIALGILQLVKPQANAIDHEPARFFDARFERVGEP
jgi:hypothetical protein